MELKNREMIETDENPALRRVQYGSLIGLLGLCILGCSFLEPYLFGTYVSNQPIQFLFLLLSGYLDCWRAELKEKI